MITTTPAQPRIVTEREIEGIEMGVLDDGRAFLNGRGLAKVAGVAASTIINQADQWKQGKRSNDLAMLLKGQGFNRPSLYIPVPGPNGIEHAYTDDVAMLILEYYAFSRPAQDAEGKPNPALENYRKLARAGLRLFIYQAIGYDPQKVVPNEWRQFHDRALLNPAPRNYFGVFHEMSAMVLTAIRGGLVVDMHTVPDISVGIAWSKHWKATSMEAQYGPSTKHPHFYPAYMTQSLANGEIEAHVYPVKAIGEFRAWMEDVYLPHKFPKYLEGKVKKKDLTASTAELILAAFETPEVPTLP